MLIQAAEGLQKNHWANESQPMVVPCVDYYVAYETEVADYGL